MIPVELSDMQADVAERWSIPLKAGLGLMMGLWLGMPVLVQALMIVMVLDVISGTVVAVQERRLGSRVAFHGLSRKAMILIVVGMSWVLQLYLRDMITIPLADLVAGFYLWHEAISILENAAKVGLPVPDNIRQVLSVLQSHDPMKRVNSGKAQK